MLAAVQKIDPSAKLGLSVHDECWILCAPHKAQACQDAVLSLVLARWCAPIVPIVAGTSLTNRKWEDTP